MFCILKSFFSKKISYFGTHINRNIANPGIKYITNSKFKNTEESLKNDLILMHRHCHYRQYVTKQSIKTCDLFQKTQFSHVPYGVLQYKDW